MIKTRYLTILFAIIFCLSLNAQSADDFRILEKQQHARVVLLLTDPRRGAVIEAYRSNELVAPASLTKIVTTATALRLLGDDYRFRTLFTHSGRVKDGVLYGDFVIRGSGDPSVASHYLPASPTRFGEDAYAALKRKGIHCIKGDIVVDASAQEIAENNSNWAPEDAGNYYAPGLYGFNIFDNRLDVYLRSGVSGSAAEVIGMAPRPAGFRLENRLTAQGEIDSAYGVSFGRVNQRLLAGNIPAHRKRYTLKIDLPDPPTYGAEYVRDIFRSRGIVCEGKARASYRPYSSVVTLGVYSSPPLRTLIRETNFRSINLWADALLLSLSSEAIRSRSSALRRECAYWQAMAGIRSESLQPDDGSGLSLCSRMTAEALAAILSKMLPKTNDIDFLTKNSFFASLPEAGLRGSVKHFKIDSSARFFLKSGSRTGMQAYAGYIVVSSGVYVIVMIADELKDASAARVVMRNCLAKLADRLINPRINE